jgi:hypothetical protein
MTTLLLERMNKVLAACQHPQVRTYLSKGADRVVTRWHNLEKGQEDTEEKEDTEAMREEDEGEKEAKKDKGKEKAEN